MTTTDILFDELAGQGGDIGVVTLNRPAALNALSLRMIHSLYAQLQTWSSAKNIKAVVIRAAEGRAFCAGGDIRQTYERICAKDSAMSQFFRDEYELNQYIHHYPKPYIAFLDGITMGGGVGISIHGSHRVGTENLLFSMPETGIGFFPDVGGTYFLPRIRSKIGYYLGLTGARIGLADCVALGIATQGVKSSSLPALLEAIRNQAFNADAKQSVSDIISQFEMQPDVSLLLEQESEIKKYFYKENMEDIISGLSSSTNKLFQQAQAILAKKSPTSLKVTLKALHAGAELSFDQCMQLEFRLASRFLASHDFREGIRAVIIDKDQQPKWKPSSLEYVRDDDVNIFFQG